MTSKRHQYIELGDKVYKRYIKTEFGILTGYRPNPHDIKQRVDFLLQTSEDKVTWEKESNPEDDKHIVLVKPIGKKIDYDDEVLEIYSEVEDRIFRQLNRKLLESGALAEYHEEKSMEINMSNALSDTDVFTIANSASIPIFKKKIKSITSKVTLDRISLKLDELNRKPSFKQALAEYSKTLQEPF